MTLTISKIDVSKIKAFKKKCGINPSLYKQYDFDDHVWKRVGIHLLPAFHHATYATLFPALIDFSYHCVLIKGCYYMRLPGGKWLKKENLQQAKKDAINIFTGMSVGGMIFDDEFCNVFFDGVIEIQEMDPLTGRPKMVSYSVGSCPQIDDCACIPFGTDFVIIPTGRMLNIWEDNMIPGDIIHKKLGLHFIWLIYRSLCNGDELDPDKNTEMDIIEQEIFNGNFCGNKEFKFSMMWISAIVQNPGINLITNLWFVGVLQGIGKGTLTKLLKLILGHNMCGTLSQDEVERGWTDHLMNRALIEVDELDVEATGSAGKGRKWWDRWIKKNTIPEFATFTERGKGTHDLINIGNYIFTTNNEDPINLSASDRRNQFVKTTDDVRWVHEASGYNIALLNKIPDDCAAGFAFYLERIDVNYDFINAAFINDVKAEGISNSVDDIESWLNLSETIPINIEIKSSELYEKFKKWEHDNISKIGRNSLTAFGRRMKKKFKNFDIQVKTKRDATYYTITKNYIKENPQQRTGIIETWQDEFNLKIEILEDVPINFNDVEKREQTQMEKIREKLLEMSKDYDFE